jgi:trehalose-phosphatase
MVNPYNVDSMAAALHRALTMDEPERRSRGVALLNHERRHDVDEWLSAFLEAARRMRPALQPVTDADFEGWLGGFLGHYRLALFLDYDGTLSPLVDHPSQAKLSDPMRRAIESCVLRTDTDVTIVSGRALDDVMKIVGIPGLSYAGNHGLEINWPDGEKFLHEDLVLYREKSQALARDLQEISRGGAWAEEKGATLTFHYRAVDRSQHLRLAEEARARIQRAGFQARDAHCAVEARPPIGWDKGHAVLHILRARYGPAWSEGVRTVYVGDDHTDEDAFRVLAGLGITFRVGGSDLPTAATRTLPNVAAVQALLGWLGRRVPRHA